MTSDRWTRAAKDTVRRSSSMDPWNPNWHGILCHKYIYIYIYVFILETCVYIYIYIHVSGTCDSPADSHGHMNTTHWLFRFGGPWAIYHRSRGFSIQTGSTGMLMGVGFGEYLTPCAIPKLHSQRNDYGMPVRSKTP